MPEVDEALNGVDLATVVGLVDHIRSEPASAATVLSANVPWTGAFRSEAHIRDFAPLPSDEPATLGGSDSAPNPVEQVLAALGNCLAVGYAANASVEGIRIQDLRIELEGTIDLRTFLGLAEGNAGFEGITVGVAIDSDAGEEQLARLHERVVGTSPVGHTLSRPVPVRVELLAH